MTVTTAAASNVTTHRAVKAAKFARYALDGGPLDSPADWAVAADLVGANPASEATQAMVAGILDVARTRQRSLARGNTAVEIAYNTGHRAALAAHAFTLAGLDLAEVDDTQWDIVGVVSESTRAVTGMFTSLFIA